MKEWYTADELAGVEGMPSTERRVRSKAEREGWECQLRVFGKGYEFHINSLPKVAQEALKAHNHQYLLKNVGLTPVSLRNNKALAASVMQPNITKKQRDTAGARGMVLKTIAELANEGMSKESAIKLVLIHAKEGTLDNPVLEGALRASVDTRGKGQGDNRYPSPRTIKRWFMEADKKGSLLPSIRQKEPIPDWLPLFRRHYNVPEKPSLHGAYEEFVKEWTRTEVPPSVYAVRRAMDKLGKVEREKGRKGSNELMNIKPFKRRSFADLKPCDVYSADGHTFDGEVAHPFHGRPFRPEITTFIDIATRRVVGVSVTLAESGLAVLDALMDSCKCGIPAILYVDNGSGYVNAMLKDEANGVLSRLGTTMKHSIAYNSKARGVVERVHKTLWVAGAKTLPNYVGKDMDRQARLSNFKATRNASNKDGVVPMLSWADFLAWVHERVEWYNKRPHSSLPKINDNGVSRHESPLEVWERFIAKGFVPEILSNEVIVHIFRPQVERKVARGEIRLFNNRYYSNALEEFHGMMVNVSYDINNAERVWAFDQETGRFIASADFAANETSYYPQSAIDHARERRADGRMKRAMVRVDEIEAERTGSPVIEHQSFVLDGFNAQETTLSPVRHEQEYDPFIMLRTQSQQTSETQQTNVTSIYESLDAAGRYDLYQKCQASSELAKQHAAWLRNYPKSKEFKYFAAQA